MNLTDLTAMVKEEANKGTRLDSAIPTRIAMAVTRLERRYTMKYLERYVLLTLDPTATEPRAVKFPSAGMKSFNFMRYYNVSLGEFVGLPQVAPEDVISNDVGLPTGFWLDGVGYIWFDNTVDAELKLEFSYNEFSTWPPTDGRHWLLDNGADLILAETMKLLSTTANEPSWSAKYDEMYSVAATDMFRMDNELRNSGRNYFMHMPETTNRMSGRYPTDNG